MNLSKTPSVIDQLFEAIDRGDFEAARYKLSTAIDRAKRSGSGKRRETVRRKSEAS